MIVDLVSKVMGFASLAIALSGGILVLLSVLYGISALWWRLSTFAKLIAEYLQRKSDFEVYKNQYDVWKKGKESQLKKCEKCHYYAELFGVDKKDG